MIDSLRVLSLSEREQVAVATTPSLWASRHLRLRTASGQTEAFTLDGREFLIEPLDDYHRRQFWKKPAQIGGTVLAIARIFHTLEQGRDTLFVLPRDQDVTTFSAGRFAHSKQRSARIEALFHGTADNVHHKVTVSGANLYLRGSQSPAGLKSIPVALLVLDEFDEMSPEAISLALERLSAQEELWAIALSTPSLPGFGIDAEWASTDRREWMVPCHVCGRSARLGGREDWQESFGGNLLGDPFAVSWRCRLCGAPWTEEEKRANVSDGEWVAQGPPEALYRGYHLTQFLSPIRKAPDFAEKWQGAQGDLEARRQFYRSVLAEAFSQEGEEIQEADYDAALASGPPHGPTGPPEKGCLTFGVDVGVGRHYLEVALWTLDRRKQVQFARIVPSLAEVDRLARIWRPRVIVIDASPEGEKARELQKARPGGAPVWLCYESDSLKEEFRPHYGEGYVVVNRTNFLDKVLGRYPTKRVSLPRDVPSEYIAHHRALLGVTELNAKGQPVKRYESRGPDHFAFAALFSEVALWAMPPARTPGGYEPPEELRGRVEVDARGMPREIGGPIPRF